MKDLFKCENDLNGMLLRVDESFVPKALSLLSCWKISRSTWWLTIP